MPFAWKSGGINIIIKNLDNRRECVKIVPYIKKEKAERVHSRAVSLFQREKIIGWKFS